VNQATVKMTKNDPRDQECCEEEVAEHKAERRLSGNSRGVGYSIDLAFARGVPSFPIVGIPGSVVTTRFPQVASRCGTERRRHRLIASAVINHVWMGRNS